MFRAQLLRRNFSLFNRVPYSRIVESAARDGHESFTIYRVRIQKPFLSKSRLIGALAVTGATYGLGRYLGVEVQVGVVEETENKNEWEVAGHEVDEEDEDDDDALLFFPTGFSRPKPTTFYRGSDPEWQEFKKLAADRPRVEKLRSDLATMIRGLASKHPAYVSILGKVDTSKGKVWIDISFPDSPPVEFERPGYELTGDLEWRKATRPVEEAHHHRLKKVLLPTEAYKALYEDTQRKASQSWKTLKAYIGWEEKPESETVQQLMQRIGGNGRSSPTAAESSTPSTAGPVSTAPANETQQSASASPVAPTDGPLKNLGFVLPDPKKLSLDMSHFQQEFRRTFKPTPLQYPRGTCIVSGLIEIHGDRARLVVDVSAAYDPKQRRYVVMASKLRTLVTYRQNPKGGP